MNRLLLVDDERPTLETLGIYLQSEGYEVFTAENGRGGLEIFDQEDVKLVITDIKMPVMDGIELLKKIKDSGKEAEVIVITGHGDMDSAIAALRHGASDFITKPIRDDALMLALERAKMKISMREQLRDYTQNLETKVEMRTRELREAQEELMRNERLATIGETVASLAHYIKNIINGLRGGMYVINSGIKKNKPDALSEGWDMVQRHVEKVSQLVLDLLTYSKERLPERKICHPNEIVSEVVELLEHTAKENDIELKADLDLDVKEGYLDAKGFYDVLLNLVSNAIDACLDDEDVSKSWQVTVKTRREIPAHGREGILVEVIDNGCGMSPETQSKLFNRFYSTKKGKGTGLGLLITQKIIHEHGGEISFCSETGTGTHFSVRLDWEVPPQI